MYNNQMRPMTKKERLEHVLSGLAALIGLFALPAYISINTIQNGVPTSKFFGFPGFLFLLPMSGGLMFGVTLLVRAARNKIQDKH